MRGRYVSLWESITLYIGFFSYCVKEKESMSLLLSNLCCMKKQKLRKKCIHRWKRVAPCAFWCIRCGGITHYNKLRAEIVYPDDSIIYSSIRPKKTTMNDVDRV